MIRRDQIHREIRHGQFGGSGTVIDTLSISVQMPVHDNSLRCAAILGQERELREQINESMHEQILDQIQPRIEFEDAFNECLRECAGLKEGMSAAPAILRLKAKLDLRERE